MSSPAAGQPAGASAPLVYRIDADDCLTYFNAGWNKSADAAGAKGLGPGDLLGVKLWTCFEDQTVLDIYIALVRRAREGSPVSFMYRCDVADRRRMYRMSIRPTEDGQVEFCSLLDREEVRPAVALLDPMAERERGRFLPMCGWCHAVALPVDFWVPIEQAAELGGFLATDRLPELRHTICPDCHESMRRKLGS